MAVLLKVEFRCDGPLCRGCPDEARIDGFAKMSASPEKTPIPQTPKGWSLGYTSYILCPKCIVADKKAHKDGPFW